MFDGRNLDEAERLVDQWITGIEARAQAARELSERLAVVSATAGSEDGLISVTVDASGGVTRLHLDERIRSRPAEATARAIMTTIRAAQAALAVAAGEATAATLGADSATGKAIIESYQARSR